MQNALLEVNFMVRRMKEGASQKYVYMKKRITKAQGNAKTVGFLYLLATLAVTALACLPLITISDELITHQLGVMSFWKVFVELANGAQPMVLALIVAVVYALMLVVLLVNVLRAFSKLGWLYKRKASRVYGFNRNVYAMDDLGKIFSSSFAAVVSAHLLIACLVASVEVQMLGYVVVGAGLFIHFVCGLAGGNVSLFDVENGLVEQKREVGRVSVVVRNVLQIAATAALFFYFITTHMLRVHIFDLFAGKELSELLAAPMELIVPAAEMLGVVFAFAMLRYALGSTEFDIEGKETAGRKNFLLFSFLALVCFGGSLAYTYLIAKAELPQATLIMAGIAAAAFVLEIILCAFPKVKRDKEEKAAAKAADAKPGNPYKPASEEVDVKTFLMETFNKPGVYDMPYGYNNAAFASAEGMYQPQSQMRK